MEMPHSSEKSFDPDLDLLLLDDLISGDQYFQDNMISIQFWLQEKDYNSIIDHIMQKNEEVQTVAYLLYKKALDLAKNDLEG